MTPSALALVVVAALAHSLWNLWLKSSRWTLASWLWSILVGIGLYAWTVPVYGLGSVPPIGWALIVVSGLFQAGYCLALTAAYDAGDLSLVYPIARGTAPIVVAGLAAMMLGERVAPLGLAGIALVAGGLLGSHLGGVAGRALPRPRASAFAVLTGLAIAGYSLVDKRAVGLIPPPLYICLVHVACAGTLAVVMRWRGESLALPRDAAERRAIAGVGAVSFSAYLMVLFAMRLAPVSYVVAAREVSVVFAAILGVAVLGERLRPLRLAGAVAVFLGLVALALSR